MVDFNSNQTISTPPGDVLKIAILERRHYCLEAQKEMKKQHFRGSSVVETFVFKAGVFALFSELEPALEADFDPAEFEKLKKDVEADDEDGKLSEAAFKQINAWLYKKNLTKFDTRKSVDHTDVEAVNSSNGF